MDDSLMYKFTRLEWLLHKRRVRGHFGGGPMADTSRGQGRILAVLKLQDGISTKDLSYLLGVRVSSLNELLTKLEKSGFVTREPSNEDKRVMLVKLTESGKNIKEPIENDFDGVFDCLTEEERRGLGEYLDRIIAALMEKSGLNDDGEFERMQEAREHFAQMLESRFAGGDLRRVFGGLGRFNPHEGRRGCCELDRRRDLNV